MNWKQNYWIVFILVLSAASLAGELANNKFHTLDFEVYYKTATRTLHQAELYNVAEDGHYVYKYSPVAGLYFIPFALLNYPAAAALYWSLLTVLLIAGLKVFYTLLDETDSQRKRNSISVVLILSLLTIGVHVHREWHLGQVNLLLLIIYIFMIRAYTKRQLLLFAALLSFSIFIKPFALIFLPYLVYKKQWLTIVYSLAFTLFLAFSPLILYPSLAQLSHLYQSWQNELAVELSAKQNLLADANHTIFSVVARYTPIKFMLTTSFSQKIYQLVVLALIGISFLFFSLRQRKKEATLNEFSFLIALIPLLAFTSENAFIFELPVIIILVCFFKILSTLQKVLLTIGCVLIGANIYDIVGSYLSTYLISISIYTFGAVMLLGVLMMKKSWIYNKQI
jgi:hypothetical protein